MKFGYKILIVVVFVVAILVVVIGFTTISNKTTQNITQNNTTSNTTTYISAVQAKELATQFTGLGVTLGTPTLTNFKGVKVWKIPVLTSGQNLFVDNIYINAVTDKRVQ